MVHGKVSSTTPYIVYHRDAQPPVQGPVWVQMSDLFTVFHTKIICVSVSKQQGQRSKVIQIFYKP